MCLVLISTRGRHPSNNPSYFKLFFPQKLPPVPSFPALHLNQKCYPKLGNKLVPFPPVSAFSRVIPYPSWYFQFSAGVSYGDKIRYFKFRCVLKTLRVCYMTEGTQVVLSNSRRQGSFTPAQEYVLSLLASPPSPT